MAPSHVVMAAGRLCFVTEISSLWALYGEAGLNVRAVLCYYNRLSAIILSRG
jgi:hypothetical protein